MYKIIVEKIETKVETQRKWLKMTDSPSEKQYDYGPEIEVKQENSYRVYEQTVDDFNLIDVIDAVNGISSAMKKIMQGK